MSANDLLWTEKYRPKTIEDAVLPKAIKKKLSAVVASGTIPNLILNGSPGMGKTTAALAIVSQLGADYIIINGSLESNIDTLRTKIAQFASSVSFTDGPKIVIMDEADYLNPTSTQPALRRFLEEFAGNCRFIFTCNNKSRIIPALHSRCDVIDYSIPREERPALQEAFAKSILKILDEEGIKYNPKAVFQLIATKTPDWRSIVGTLQSYALGGEIDVGILTAIDETVFADLLTALKEKKFNDVRRWVGQNPDIEAAELFRRLYDVASEKVAKESIPNLVLILGEWQFKATHAVDQEINTMACLTEIMANVTWQ